VRGLSEIAPGVLVGTSSFELTTTTVVAGSEGGCLLIDPAVQQRVRFLQVNLNGTLPELGVFDVIFLRNVMIYFDMETKRQVVARMLSALKPGGYFLVGHSESLNGISDAMRATAPSIYRKT